MMRLIALTLLLISGVACHAQNPGVQRGETVWVDVPTGRLKTEVFESPQLGEQPTLLVLLHGDLLGPQSTDPYHYVLAREIAARTTDVVAAGMLRPGYREGNGDRSDGEPFEATGDNYTPEVVDAIAAATKHLQSLYQARSVVIVGHSGGAAIGALVLGNYPELADAAILASCPCDLPAWRKHMMAEQQNPIWEAPIRGLSPLDFATNVGASTFVHLLVGSDDRVALPEYSEAYARTLDEQGINVRMTVLPGLGHEIFLEDPVIKATLESVRNLKR